jgi:hypothetical protein
MSAFGCLGVAQIEVVLANGNATQEACKEAGFTVQARY